MRTMASTNPSAARLSRSTSDLACVNPQRASSSRYPFELFSASCSKGGFQRRSTRSPKPRYFYIFNSASPYTTTVLLALAILAILLILDLADEVPKTR